MHQPHKMVKHTQTIRRQETTNYLSVFDHFLGLAIKGLTSPRPHQKNYTVSFLPTSEQDVKKRY